MMVINMIPKKIYLNYVNEDDDEKTWSEEPVSVNDCDMQNREYTDLSKVIHDASEEPEEDLILCDSIHLRYFVGCWNRNFPWANYCKIHGITRWAYVKDIFPKGVEQ